VTQPLRVVTFNVRHGLAFDRTDSWPWRRDRVAGALARCSPHLVCLQEVRSFQQRYLRRRLPGHGVWSRPRGRWFGERLPVAWDRARLKLVDRGVVWLSETPDVPGSRGWDAMAPRVCTWAVLDDAALGRVAVLNAHLDSRGATARVEGARAIARLAEGLGVPSLICGDLNAGEETPPLEVLRAAGFRDTFREAHPGTDGRTFHRFDGRPRYAKLDYVLADARWTVVDAGIDREPVDGGWPSDHFPVWADLVEAA